MSDHKASVQHRSRRTVVQRFFKHGAIGLGVQIVLLLFLGFVGNFVSPVDALFERFLRIYEPMIVLIARYGAFKGESAMIEPVWIGIGLGVLFYSIIFALVAILLKRR